MTGILEEIMVERGDIVKKGQVLAQLKSELEKVAVEQAQARVEFSIRKVGRNEELSRKQLISIHEKDELETEVQLAKLQLREANERLKQRTILSPINGVVMERYTSPGEYVGEKPILKIASYDPLNVEVIVSVKSFGTIKRGMSAKVYPELSISGKYTAKVTIIDQIMDAASGTFGIRLELPNPSYKLPAGLRCKIRFLED